MKVGDIIDGRFVIEEPVAVGGMARVFRARDQQSGTIVAVKVVTHADPNAHARFLREAGVLAEIHHPGIVRYIDHGRIGQDKSYLVMEWLDGMDLAAYLRNLRLDSSEHSLGGETLVDLDPPVRSPTGTLISSGVPIPEVPTLPDPTSMRPVMGLEGPMLPLPDVVHLGRRLASAVAELHRRSIIHRDIKPANIFLCGGAIEQLKLLDLGTVRRSQVAMPMTTPGTLIGTPHYMAPEQAHANDQVCPATDVWSIGCVLYECLAGFRPFSGGQIVVILTRILMEDPDPIHEIRPDIPRDFADLVMSTMAKAPEDRPENAAALAAALDSWSVGEVSSKSPYYGRPPTIATSPTLSTAERRVSCMVLAEPLAEQAWQQGDYDEAARAAQHAGGGDLQLLASGALLITVPDVPTPTDQAARAARIALRLRATFPALRQTLATAYSEGKVPLGDAVSAAGEALAAIARGTIWVDRLTTSLIDARFVLTEEGKDTYLHEERSSESVRTVLGKPTWAVGRDHELRSLLAIFEQCVEEPISRAVLVTAPPGMGKSRLRYEFERLLRRRGTDCVLLHGQGDQVNAGSSFVMLAPGIRRLAGIGDSDPSFMQRQKLRALVASNVAAKDHVRIASALGEMIGVSFAEEADQGLEAARHDPVLLNQLIQKAWRDWLTAECARRPVLILLEDLHWGDLPSVEFIDGALSTLAEMPLMVLALARPEVHTVFPRLWSQRGVQEIPLYPLSRRACTDFVQKLLGNEMNEEAMRAVVERSGGNAFYLEELVRAAAESGGQGKLPDTVIGMVQARLDALGPEAKRILRAGSVFGDVFWRGGINALTGDSSVFDVGEWLEDLVAREIIAKDASSRIAGETQYHFRHELFRESAYAMLTAADLRQGHTLAAAWLEKVGPRDDLALAKHYLRSSHTGRAVPYILRAAEVAASRGELALVIRWAERAVGAGAADEALGELRALQAMAAYWSSDYAHALEWGSEAAGHLRRGSSHYFAALTTAMEAAAELGEAVRFDELVEDAISSPCEADAGAAKLICMARGAMQLVLSGRLRSADEVLARANAVVDEVGTVGEVSDAAMAEMRQAQGMRAGYGGNLMELAASAEAAVLALQGAGDFRSLAAAGMYEAWSWAQIGQSHRAAELGEQRLRYCREHNIAHGILHAKAALGAILLECAGGLDRARELLGEALDDARQARNARVQGWVLAYLSMALVRAGELAEAERTAAEAVSALGAAPLVQAWAYSAHARALLALGRTEEARASGQRAMEMLGTRDSGDRGGLLPGEALVRLVWVQILEASGDQAAANAAVTEAVARLDAQVERISRPEWRDAFTAIPAHAELRRRLSP